MSLHSAPLCDLNFLPRKPISLQTVQEDFSSDGGLLLLREWDQQLGLTQGFAEQIQDPRLDPQHSVLQMVRSRVYGILAGYTDQNDHQLLRTDPIFKLLSGHMPQQAPLASQPTLSRFENAIRPTDLFRLEDWFIGRFVESFSTPPSEVTLDLDVFDDPTHGQQQLTLFHGFYDQYQYLVRAITCAENDLVILPVLLPGTAEAGLGVEEDLQRIVQALRQKYPQVLIRLRADAGYARPQLYQTCEQLGIEYTIGLGMNPVLRQASQDLVEQAQANYQATGEHQRVFESFPYQAASWSTPRWVVVKCEVTAQGINQRAVVSNRPGVQTLPQGIYDEYVRRGEAENRHKELKCELGTDRLSDHRYLANSFRMFLHCLSANFLVFLRQRVAQSLEEFPPGDESIGPESTEPESTEPESTEPESIGPESIGPESIGPESTEPADPSEVSVGDPEPLENEAWTQAERRREWNRRRRRDPLGEGHASTWRLRLIKVAVRVRVTSRRVWIYVSGSWPFLHHLEQVAQAILEGS